MIAEPIELQKPRFQSTQIIGKQDQKEDRARGTKVRDEATSLWVEPERTILREDQETKCIYNIFNGKYSMLPIGERHEGYMTLEEKVAVEQNRGKYVQGLKISIEGNIGSGNIANPVCSQNIYKMFQGRAAMGRG